MAMVFGMLTFLLNFIPNIGSMIAIFIPLPVPCPLPPPGLGRLPPQQPWLCQWQLAEPFIGRVLCRSSTSTRYLSREQKQRRPSPFWLSRNIAQTHRCIFVLKRSCWCGSQG